MLAELRSPAFTWFGILGGALTLVGRSGEFITLVHWIRRLAESWSAWLGEFWSFVGGLLGVQVPHAIALFLSLVIFLVSLGIGARMLPAATVERKPNLRSTIATVVVVFLVLFAVATAMKLITALAIAPLGAFVGILIYPAAVVAIFYLRGKYLYSYEIVAIIIYILMLIGLFGPRNSL